MSASVVSKPIFYIKVTEDKTNISTPMLSGSGKKVVSFGSLDASAPPKISGGGFATYSSTSGSVGFNFGSSKGVLNSRFLCAVIRTGLQRRKSVLIIFLVVF